MEGPFDIFPSWDMETCIGRTETGRRLEVQYADIWGILAYAQFSRVSGRLVTMPFLCFRNCQSLNISVTKVKLTFRALA